MPLTDYDADYRLAVLLTGTHRAAAEAVRVAFRTRQTVIEAALRPSLGERLRRRLSRSAPASESGLVGTVLSLPPEDRVAVVLRFYQQWTDKEMASLLPPGTLSSALSRLVTQSGGLAQLRETDVSTNLAEQLTPELHAFAASLRTPDTLRPEALVRENRRRLVTRAATSAVLLATVGAFSLVPSLRTAVQETALRLYYGWRHPLQEVQPRIALPNPEPVVASDAREAQRLLRLDPAKASKEYGLFYPWELPPDFRVIKSTANHGASPQDGAVKIDKQTVYMRLDFRGGPRDEWIYTMQTLRKRGVAEETPDKLPKGTRMVTIRGYNVYLQPVNMEGVTYFSLALDYGDGWYHWLWGSSPMYVEEIVQLLESLLK